VIPTRRKSAHGDAAHGSTRRDWDELQTRWASGEVLTPAEDSRRLLGAGDDPAAKRELEFFAGLRAELTRGEGAAPRELIERVLERRHTHAHLRVVAKGEAPAPPAARRGLRWLVPVIGTTGAAALSVAAFAAWRGWNSPALERGQRSEPSVAAAAARAELVMASGKVRVGGSEAEVGRAPLAIAQRISTGEGRACLTIDPGIFVCLATHTEIVLESLLESDLRARVARGTAIAALDRQATGRTFSLTAGGVTATALGTVFSVERTGGPGAVGVTVMKGSVRVASGGATERLGPHAQLRFSAEAPRAARRSVGRTEEARLWALIAPRDLWANPELGVLEIAGEAGDTVQIDAEGPLPLPVSAFVPAGKRRVTVSFAGSRGEATTLVDVVAGEIRRVTSLEPDALPDARTPRSKPANAGALLAAARRELALGNTRGALSLYRRLRQAFPASPEARTVLVTTGKLELDLSEPAAALASFDDYLRGGGALSPEALAGKIRALRALGRTDEERRVIRQYLERYPNGFEAPVLKQRLASPRSP
jgi:hypothetical protein